MRNRLARVIVLILVTLLALPINVFATDLSITAWATGDALNASNLGSRMTSITTWANGNITNSNIGSSAAIVGSKLDLTSGTGRISHSTSVTSDAPVFTSGTTFNNVATAFTAWRLTVTNTNSASTSRLIDLRVGSTIIASISRVGQLMLTPQDWASGPSTLMEGAWFNVASATYTDNMTAASGTAPRFIAYAFQRPALAAGNTSVTTTNAATVFIASAPVTSTNMTLTNRYALWVDQGDVRIGGSVFASGSMTVVGNLAVDGQISGAIVPATVSGTPVQNGLYRESIVKGWAYINATPSLVDSFNVSSITDNAGAGDVTVTWDRDFANATYALAGSGEPYAVIAIIAGGQLAGSVRYETRNSAGTATDLIHSVMAIGDQ